LGESLSERADDAQRDKVVVNDKSASPSKTENGDMVDFVRRNDSQDTCKCG
jgi:hypothetical protein